MSGFSQFIPFILVFLLFWFLILRPQNQEREAQEALVASLATDDEVVTQSGIHGRIVTVNADTVILRIANNTQIKIDKTFIARRIESGSGK